MEKLGKQFGLHKGLTLYRLGYLCQTCVKHVPGLTFQGLLIKQTIIPLTLMVRVQVRIFKKFQKYA